MGQAWKKRDVVPAQGALDTDLALPDSLTFRKEGHGERMLPSGGSADNYRTHLIRYRFAVGAIEGIAQMDVLDIACGIGYGSNLLARYAKSVVGVDISADAVSFAESRYATDRIVGDKGIARHPQPNLSYAQMSATELQFPDAHFDAVVSFETLEHVDDPARMLSEVARVMRPGARLVLSTPNREMTPQRGGRPVNPFHIREFTREELRQMLEPDFEDIRFFGQNAMRSGLRTSLVRAAVGIVKALDVFDLRSRLSSRVKGVVRHAVYGASEIGVMDDAVEKPLVWVAVCRRKGERTSG